MKNSIKFSIYSMLFICTILGLTNACTTKKDNPITSPIPLKFGTVKDVEGNSYRTIAIGSQVWMADNLKTTKFNDGTPIPQFTTYPEWTSKTPGYSWYEFDAAIYKDKYGALYNWYTVNTGILAPNGWHVPSKNDWQTLINYLGGEDVTGGKLKESGYAHWRSPNTGATNSSGFTALPAGSFSYSMGYFHSIGEIASFWASDSSSLHEGNGVVMFLRWDREEAAVSSGSEWLWDGESVRCIKN